jgi:hypothetical protein
VSPSVKEEEVIMSKANTKSSFGQYLHLYPPSVMSNEEDLVLSTDVQTEARSRMLGRYKQALLFPSVSGTGAGSTG